MSNSIQYELNGLWFKYYTSSIPSEKRVELADAFIKRYKDKVSMTSNRFTHPALIKKGRYDVPRQSIAEILSDFILRAEEDSTRTVKSRDLELDHDDRYKENSFRIFENDLDDAAKEAGEKIPAYSKSWEQAYDGMNPPRMTRTCKPVSAHQVKAELSRVKQYPEFYATTFEEDYGKDYDDTIRRIRRLDLDRVRTCEQCGDGFYARDLRRKVCDRQQGVLESGIRSKRSACELNHKRREEMWRMRIKRQR